LKFFGIILKIFKYFVVEMKKKQLHTYLHCIVAQLCFLLYGGQILADTLALHFEHITKKDGLSATLMYRMIEGSDGILWIGSKDGGGLYKYDGYKLTAFMSNFNDKQSISNNVITALMEDSKQNIWVGTQGGGLNRFDPFSEKFEHYKQDPYDKNSLINNNVSAIMEDSYGNIWIGTRRGFGRLENLEGGFCSYLVSNKNGLKHNYENNIACMVQDLNQPEKIWLGTSAGLKCFSTLSLDFVHVDNPYTETAVWQDTGKPRQLPITDMFQDQNGVLWMGTMGAGLLRYDPRKDEWQQHTFENIIDPGNLYSYNEIFDLFWHPPHQIWLGSEKQLGYFDISTKQFHFTYPQFADTSSILNTGYYSVLIDHNNFLWGGAYLGLSRTTAPINQPAINPPIYNRITELIVLGKPFDTEKAISYTHSIELLSDQNELSFSFSVVNPAYPEQVLYQYRLLGKDSHWSSISGDQNLQVHYHNLRGGSYEFQTRARYPQQDWSTPATLSINIKKSFWQSYWFYTLLILVIISIGLVIHSYHQQIVKEKEAIKTTYNQKLLEMEMTSLRSQMNPHFLFNCLNSIKHFIIKNDTREASRFLSKFSQLMRLILQNSQSAMISIQNELKALELYIQLESLRFENKFHYTIAIDPEIDTQLTQVPPMILQPYVENAIWHGLLHKESEGHLSIRVNREHDSLCITIEDNGIGRERAHELKSRTAIKHKSYGMQITSNRLKLVEQLHQLKTDIQITDLYTTMGIPAGTKVDILIPIQIHTEKKEALSKKSNVVL